MSKNNKFKNFINKKGFTIAIYSCAGVLIALTGIMSAKNMSSNKNNKVEEPIQLEQENQQANQSDVKSYLDNSKVNTKPENTSENQKKENKKVEENQTENQQKSNSQATSDNKEKPQSNTKPSENQTTNKSASQNSDEKVFSLFDDSKEMSWPVNGQIVMDYSIETAVYDKTLEQYRTNDVLCIAADVGTEVKASAEGIVKSVYKDREHGTTVVIDHGNGWLSTYSQLNDNLTVKEGDITSEGAVIGTVAEPTYYSSMLGAHLEFKLTKNNESTDPKLVLAQYDE